MIRLITIFAAAALVTAALNVACRGERWPAPSAMLLEQDNRLRPIPAPPLGLAFDLTRSPAAPSPARVRLGRWLFFDRRLSADSTVSCATCHQPKYAFSQHTAVATGIGGHTGRRKVLPIINLAGAARPTNFRTGPQAAFFWDGRSTSLERQALEPIANPVEMGSSATLVVSTVTSIQGYRRYFSEAFGDGGVSASRIARALADYERTRLSGNSPFDRWRFGNEARAISESAKSGYRLFTGKAQCLHCHGGNSFSGGGFHNTGIGWDRRSRTFTDLGHYLVTKGTDIEDWPGTFKAPTLREVSRHPPYMHNGSIATLREVVEFYNRGANPNPDLSAFIHPLGLSSQDVDDIVAFLETLNGEGWQDDGPHLFPR